MQNCGDFAVCPLSKEFQKKHLARIVLEFIDEPDQRTPALLFQVLHFRIRGAMRRNGDFFERHAHGFPTALDSEIIDQRGSGHAQNPEYGFLIAGRQFGPVLICLKIHTPDEFLGGADIVYLGANEAIHVSKGVLVNTREPYRVRAQVLRSCELPA